LRTVTPLDPLEEKFSICAPPEPVMVADPRNEQEGGGGDALLAAPRNPSRPDSIAGGGMREAAWRDWKWRLLGRSDS
jgi:hypothetical protein